MDGKKLKLHEGKIHRLRVEAIFEASCSGVISQAAVEVLRGVP